MVWLPNGEKISKISLFSRTWQSDRHTDRQTTHNGTSRTYASHRATKIYIHTNKFRIKTAYHILCTTKLIQFSEYCTLLRCFLYKQSISVVTTYKPGDPKVTLGKLRELLCLYGLAPEYLTRPCVLLSTSSGQPHLRSSEDNKLLVPRSLTASMGFSCISFSCSSGPTSWNTLPTRVRDSSLTLEQFKCLLTASLFVWLSPHAP